MAKKKGKGKKGKKPPKQREKSKSIVSTRSTKSQKSEGRRHILDVFSRDSNSSSGSGESEADSLFDTSSDEEKEPTITIEIPQPTETVQKPKGKGKKDKKKGKKVVMEVPEEEPPPEEEDFRLQFIMPSLVPDEPTDVIEAEPEAPPEKKKKAKKPKGPKKKKLSKKEAQALAERERIEAEAEAIRLAEEERLRVIQERLDAIEKEKREIVEQQIRVEQLEMQKMYLQQLVDVNERRRRAENDEAEWKIYVNCGRLPNPSKCDMMNTYLHLWEHVIDKTLMEEAGKRTSDVLQLLDELDDLIDIGLASNSTIDNWKWIRNLFREHQKQSLDVATYRLLRNVEINLNRINIPTADYQYTDSNFSLSLWLLIQLPTPMPNPRRPAKARIETNFPDIKMEVQFPQSLDGTGLAIRALYQNYDHLSDLSSSFERPKRPDALKLDILTAIKQEWHEKLLYKYDHRVRLPPEPPQMNDDGTYEEVVEVEEPVIGPEDEVPLVKYQKLEPTASEFFIANEDRIYSDMRIGYVKDCDFEGAEIINLRKYTIIGGVFTLNILRQPPQPQDFVTLELTVTPLLLPKELEFYDFNVEYNPPPPPEPGARRTPEEIEEELILQEAEFENLILINLTWPAHVIFLELPIVCRWNDSIREWTKKGVYDIKHNEEKGTLSFRTGQCGTFGLATLCYVNLPYQAWEIRPEANGSLTLQITAAILLIEFNVKGGLVALTQLQNSPNMALQDQIGVYYKLPKLMRLMQTTGVDVFPPIDSFCYVENTCEKHWPTMKHLYYNMAQMASYFNFAWSRWNATVGRREVVFQMREYHVDKPKQKLHQMVMVTTLRALFIDCTEVSQSFTDLGVEGTKFYCDLFALMKGTSPMMIQNKCKASPVDMVYAFYELLLVTRIMSFS